MAWNYQTNLEKQKQRERAKLLCPESTKSTRILLTEEQKRENRKLQRRAQRAKKQEENDE